MAGRCRRDHLVQIRELVQAEPVQVVVAKAVQQELHLLVWRVARPAQPPSHVVRLVTGRAQQCRDSPPTTVQLTTAASRKRVPAVFDQVSMSTCGSRNVGPGPTPSSEQTGVSPVWPQGFTRGASHLHMARWRRVLERAADARCRRPDSRREGRAAAAGRLAGRVPGFLSLGHADNTAARRCAMRCARCIRGRVAAMLALAMVWWLALRAHR